MSEEDFSDEDGIRASELEAEFADMDALEEALAALATTPLYVAPVANSGRPKITATKPSAGFYGTVIKEFTMPNGDPAIKYNIVVD